MKHEEFMQILKKYRQGTASPEEKQLIDAWYDAIGASAPVDEIKVKQLENAYWASISRRTGITDQLPGRNGRTRLFMYSMGIAASLFLVAIVTVLLLNDNSTKNQLTESTGNVKGTPGNQDSSMSWKELINTNKIAQVYTLPDGSHITLEPQSQVRFSSNFNQHDREIHFTGTAFFQISHNAQLPFIVKTDKGVTTKVLGTSFTVKAVEGERNVTVSVKTGKVAVSTTPRKKTMNMSEVILTPNQELIYDREAESISRRIVENPEPIIAVEEVKRMRFDNAPVAEIFSAIEKIYGVDLVFDEKAFAQCKLTTSVSDSDLFRRLNIISSAIGASYSVEEDKIVITGAGCPME